MELDIRPEPPEPVRSAITEAIESVETREPESAWWRAGVDELAVGEDS